MTPKEQLLSSIKPEPDDWDGQGGAATNAAAIDRARRVASDVFEWDDPDFVVPASMPSTDGGWLFEWHPQPVMIEIAPEGFPVKVWVGPPLEHKDRSACPDGGTCHHECEPSSCFRVRHCGPLSGVFSGDRWPTHIEATHKDRETGGQK